jgi:hypothetical protein
MYIGDTIELTNVNKPREALDWTMKMIKRVHKVLKSVFEEFEGEEKLVKGLQEYEELGSRTATFGRGMRVVSVNDFG